MITTLLIIIIALVLDWVVGEPKRWHPLVGFGLLAQGIEKRLNAPAVSPVQQLLRGVVAALLVILPFTLIAWLLSLSSQLNVIAGIVLLSLAIGHKSLHDHVEPIFTAMSTNNEDTARMLTGRIVSRDVEALDIPVAAIESVLENGNDSIFATLFWFIVAGIPGVVGYRLVNTLDAMWGYKNTHYLYFGRFVARLDDLLNYVPARLTALSYSLLGNCKDSLRCMLSQSRAWSSPNAGPVMAAGAGSLGVLLGGPARYENVWHQRPLLGCGHEPQAEDILRSLQLIRHTVWLWLLVLVIFAGMTHA